MRRLSPLALGLFTTAMFLACTGEDPPVGSPSQSTDGGGNAPDAVALAEAGSVDEAATPADAHIPTCIGQTFGPVRTFQLDIGDAGTEQVLGLRIIAAQEATAGSFDAYYAKRQKAGDLTALFAGTVVLPPDGQPKLSGAQPLVARPGGTEQRSPARAADASFLLFTDATGAGGARTIRIALPATGSAPPFAFENDTAATLGADTSDDADPWIAGTRAVYWAGANGSLPFRIYRAPVLPAAQGKPAFGAGALLGSPCPIDSFQNCGTPVVSPDETVMLFGAWNNMGSDFDPAVYEITITPNADGSVLPDPHAMQHPELGFHTPSWMSADACMVLLQRSNRDDLAYALRTPK